MKAAELLRLYEAGRRAWIRATSVAFAATGGTSFYRANLTDASFAGAQLRGTDFQQATLTGVIWREAEGLAWVRLDERLE